MNLLDNEKKIKKIDLLMNKNKKDHDMLMNWWIKIKNKNKIYVILFVKYDKFIFKF